MDAPRTPPRFRIAPSPTGYFHVGGARTALYNWALAKRLGGTFVLRIEDTDADRNRPEWNHGIIDALAWIGIHSDDPTFEGPYFQSHDAEHHVAEAGRLFESGAAYYCEMTPDEIQERAKAEGVTGYGGWSRDLGLGPDAGRVLRFRVPSGTTVVRDLVRGEVVFDNATIEDFVLLRGNGSPMFLLANVVDDVTMRISHVIRAEEHLPNTPKQQMLWEALGHESPVWAHVPLLVNEQRKKISKRRDKVALESYRDEGYLADAMVNYLMTLGWSPGDEEIQPWSAMQEAFALEDVAKSPAFFDLKKLAAFNGTYIRAMSVDEFVAAAEPWCAQWREAHPDATWDADQFAAMAPFIQQRATTLAEAPGVVDFMFLPHPQFDEKDLSKAWAVENAADLVAETITAYETCEWTHDVLKAAFDAIAEAHGLKPGKAQAPIRAAITGRGVGPPLYEAMELLGRAEVLRRLRALPGGRPRRVSDDLWSATTAFDAPVVDPTPVGGVRILQRRRWPKRAFLSLLAVVLVMVGYFGISLYQVWATGRSDEARDVDAIVVMGAAQYDGRPSLQLQARLDHVLELWVAGYADTIVVTGGKQPGDRFTEADASAEYLIEHGVPDAAIVREREGRSSYESLEGVAQLLAPLGKRSVLIVSDPFHLLRSRLSAEELGLTAYVSPTPTTTVTGGEEFAREVKEAAGVAVGRIIGFDHLLDITG